MRTWTRFTLAGSFLALLLLLAACGQPGISAEDAESLRSDVEAIEGRLNDLSEQIAAIEEEEDDPATVAGESQLTLQEIQAELEELREALEPPEPEPAPEGGGGGVGGGDPLAPANP